MAKQGIWSKEEHDCFLEAIKIYPQGPWRAISKFIGTRSVRQVQTHAQKYHEKIQRRMRGNHKDRKTWARTEHRIDQDLLNCCRLSEGLGIPMSSVLLKAPEENDVAFSFKQLLDESQSLSGSSPSHVSHTGLLDDALVKLEPSSDQVTEELLSGLPSFSESLDFLIEYYSD